MSYRWTKSSLQVDDLSSGPVNSLVVIIIYTVTYRPRLEVGMHGQWEY